MFCLRWHLLYSSVCSIIVYFSLFVICLSSRIRLTFFFLTLPLCDYSQLSCDYQVLSLKPDQGSCWIDESERYVQEEVKLPRVVITSAEIGLRTMMEEFVRLTPKWSPVQFQKTALILFLTFELGHSNSSTCCWVIKEIRQG